MNLNDHVDNINKIKLFEKDEGFGIVSIYYLEIDCKVSYHLSIKNQKNIICISSRLISETWENNELLSSGSRQGTFSLDIPLKDKENIYSLCGDIWQGLHNIFTNTFKDNLIFVKNKEIDYVRKVDK